MKSLATPGLLLLLLLVQPVSAAVVHNEAVNGDLSTNEASPTPLTFLPGGNTIVGTVRTGGTTPDPRDYITFTIGASLRLIMLNLVSLAPNNITFVAFNAGTTSFIPSFETDTQFLAGIHIDQNDFGTDLMPLFVSRNVTTNALPAPELGPGSYCFVVQQANAVLTSYTLEFVLDGGLPAPEGTWGAIKRLYR